MLGLSVDSEPCLKAWAESLGGITFPLLSDFYPHGEVANKFGVLRSEGYTERALYIIDKQGFIRYVDVHDIDLQPENRELFRVISEIDRSLSERYKKIRTNMDSSKDPLADVILYCTPWCEDCPKARQFLEDLDVPFLEVDISRDWGAAERVRTWAGGLESTPTIKIRDKVFVNFEKGAVEKAIKDIG